MQNRNFLSCDFKFSYSIQQIKQMTEENKMHLPYVLTGITTKIYALFFQKLVLFDSEILYAKHLRHYDHQCEGVAILMNFLERKIKKRQILAFQTIKNPGSELQQEDQFVGANEIKNFKTKTYLKNLEENVTPKTKFFTRANTSIQESDNSFIFSPNVRKNGKESSKTQYCGSSVTDGVQRNDILKKLLIRVKKVNTQAYQQQLQPAKSSYFNLTLGKQSLQTFQNNCHCECHPSTGKKENKQLKRQKILQKFQNIQRKIYYEEPPLYYASYATPRTVHTRRRPKISSTYSVYEPLTFQERPTEVVYIQPRVGKNEVYETGNSGLSSSKSVTHINYAKQVYI